MWVDGSIYVMLQGLTFLATAFSGEDAYKYINPFVLFWLKICLGEGACMLLAIKTFRSTSFAEWRSDKKSHDTGFIPKPPNPAP